MDQLTDDIVGINTIMTTTINKNKYVQAQQDLRQLQNEFLSKRIRSGYYSGVTSSGINYIDTNPSSTMNNGTIKSFHQFTPSHSTDLAVKQPLQTTTVNNPNMENTTVILAHGFSQALCQYSENIDAIAEQAASRVIAFDWIGMGSSERNPLFIPKRTPFSIFETYYSDKIDKVTFQQLMTPNQRINNNVASVDNKNAVRSFLTQAKNLSSPCQSHYYTPEKAVSYFIDPLLTLFKELDIHGPQSVITDISGDETQQQAIQDMNTPHYSQKDVFLVAHSLGGLLSSHFVSKYPKLVQKLILVSPVGVSEGFGTENDLDIFESSTNPSDSLLDTSDPPDLAQSPQPQLLHSTIFNLINILWRTNTGIPQGLMRLLPHSVGHGIARSLATRMHTNGNGEVKMCKEDQALLNTFLHKILSAPPVGEYSMNSILHTDYPKCVYNDELNDLIQNLVKSSTDKDKDRINLANIQADGFIEYVPYASDFKIKYHYAAMKHGQNLKNNVANLSQVNLHPLENTIPLKHDDIRQLSVFARSPLEISKLLPQMKDISVDFIYGDNDWLLQCDVPLILRENQQQRRADNKTKDLFNDISLHITPNAGHHLYSNNTTHFNNTIIDIISRYHGFYHPNLATKHFVKNTVLPHPHSTINKNQLLDRYLRDLPPVPQPRSLANIMTNSTSKCKHYEHCSVSTAWHHTRSKVSSAIESLNIKRANAVKKLGCKQNPHQSTQRSNITNKKKDTPQSSHKPPHP